MYVYLSHTSKCAHTHTHTHQTKSGLRQPVVKLCDTMNVSYNAAVSRYKLSCVFPDLFCSAVNMKLVSCLCYDVHAWVSFTILHDRKLRSICIKNFCRS
ncbi:Uncharacterized protein HZ326_1008 [Fusarium oxysporum f. sp. albedinis]|nr:Uncharacterized protein HZ326_1008 [Fusarium oxysporum f. sp. albedinis]